MICPTTALIDSIPKEAADACEEVLYKVKRGEVNVREVHVRAGTEKELVKKLKAAKQLSPQTISLNGTVRNFQQVIDTYL